MADERPCAVLRAAALDRLLAGLFAAGFLVAVPAAAAAQEVRGRVVEERSRQGIADFPIRVWGPDGRPLVEVETDPDGFFRFPLGGVGMYRVAAEQLGYSRVEAEFDYLQDGDVVLPAFVVMTQAIALDSISARVTRGLQPGTAPVATSGAGQVMAGARLATLERSGMDVLAAARTLTGVRVRQYRDATGRERICIESRRGHADIQGGGGCNWVAIVIDNVVISVPEETIRHMRDLTQFESIQYLSPTEAGFRYGNGSGALLLWTRGRGPYVAAERNGR